MNKKFLALFLVIALLLSSIPVTASAERPETAAPVSAERQTAVPEQPSGTQSGPAEAELPFTDVEHIWYYDAVKYVYSKNIFSGVGDNKFDPMGNMTRSMFVAVLSRMAGAEETEFGTASAFKDVKSNFWYTAAINWAVAFQITSGTGNNRFSPNDAVTREQIAVFFAKFLDAYGVVLPDADVTGLPRDLAKASSWATGSIMTLWKTGLMIGDGVYFNPKRLCTRAEAASMCMRVHEYILKAQGLRLDYDEKATEGDDSVGTKGVEPDFTLTILSSVTSMTAAEVFDALTAQNLTTADPENNETVITVTGGNGVFTVSGLHTVLGEQLAGFEEGSTFRVALNDERLSFDGLDASVREYDFSTVNDQVMNVSLSDDLVALPVTALSNIVQDGSPVEMIDAALYTAGNEITVNDFTSGSFTYTGSGIDKDTVLAVYTTGGKASAKPGDEDFDGRVAYVKITAKNGSSYTFTNAQTDEVLFFPDILPVPANADLNTDGKANTVQYGATTLDFSGDDYECLGLTSETVPEKGDYLAFYTGALTTGNITGYGLIDKVETASGVTTITYTSKTWDDVENTMALFSTEEVSGEELMEDTDINVIKQNVAEQAVKSGFAAEAARYLTTFVLENEVEGQSIGGDVLKGFSFSYADGTPVPGYAVRAAVRKGAVSIGDPDVDVEINTKVEHISSGFHVLLGVSFTITINVTATASIEIAVSGQFVEELGISTDISGKAKWSSWGIFPYISDYTVTGNVDVLDFTGLNFNATVKTKENTDAYLVNSIADKIKGLLDRFGEDDGDYFSDDLATKYATMIKEESDLVEVLRVKLLNKEFRVPTPLPIIHIVLEADFVVKADAVISAGIDFGFTNGKRYIFNFSVLGHTATNDTVTLIPDTYDLTVYVMGRLELRAGIELIFKIGLLDTKLDYVGFTADVGAYLELYGYFYYTYHRVSGSPAETHWSGALYIEIGIYLNLSFKAEVKGLVTTSLTLYEHKWPLWKFGDENNILDFTTPQEKMPEISLKQYLRNSYLPESVFTMNNMNMKTGKTKTVNFDDKTESNFTISISNSKFTYDPSNNQITVHPDKDDIRLEGTLTITYNLKPLAFSSDPIQRKVKLTWSNLRDGYVIMPYSNGGSYVQPVNEAYEAAVTKPADPVRQGYVFDGWYSNEELTTPYVFPATMPAEDAMIYAKWAPATDTPYTVEHWQQKLGSDEYEIVDTEEFTGTTDTAVSPALKHYEGFTSPVKQALTITADGAATQRYYYARNKHTLVFDATSVGSISSSIDLYYGATISIPKAAEDGYIFDGWYEDQSFSGSQFADTTMPDRDVTCYGKFTRDTVTLYSYRIEYYLLDSNGIYALQSSKTLSAAAGTELTVSSLYAGDNAYAPLTGDIAKELQAVTVNGIAVEASAKVAVPANNTLIVKIKFRNKPVSSCALTYHLSGGTAKNLPANAESFTKVVLPDPTKTYYIFDGWYYDSALKNPVTDEDTNASGTTVTITAATDFYVKWKNNFVIYSFYNNLADQNTAVTTLQVECGKATALTAFSEMGISNPGYAFYGWATSASGSIVYNDKSTVTPAAADAGKNIKLYAVWIVVVYRIEYINDAPDSSYTLSGTTDTGYTVQREVTLLTLEPKDGYQFLGWYKSDGTKVTSIPLGSTGNYTLTAKWAHGGVFQLSYVSTSSGTSTYKVTRTKPEGVASFTTDVQRVYYRTQNGTAIGGTASAVHFKHVGGADVYLEFGQSDTSKTFQVTGENPTAIYSGNGTTNCYATQWTFGTNRYYTVEISYVESASGICVGLKGTTTSVDRYLSQPSKYSLTKDFYTRAYAKTLFSGIMTIDDHYCFSTTSPKYVQYTPFDSIEGPDTSVKTDFQNYLKATCNAYQTYFAGYIHEVDDGYQWMRFETLDGTTVKNTGTFKFSYKDSDKCTDWNYYNYPLCKTSGLLELVSSETDNFNGVQNGSHWEVKITNPAYKVRITFDASGEDDDDWELKSATAYTRIRDTREPQQYGMAPLAFGTYHKGDLLVMTVVFDEAIQTSDFTPGTEMLNFTELRKLGVNISLPSHITAVGSNVVLVECTVIGDFTVDTTMNNKLINLKGCTNYTVKDFAD